MNLKPSSLALAVLCLVSFSGLRHETLAQQVAEDLRVGLFVNPPFVMVEGDQFTGMAIELWENLATRLGQSYDYVQFKTVGDLIDATAAGSVDVAVTSISINEDRARRIDFTQPWFDGGDRIMVGTEATGGLRGLIAGLSDAGYLKAYLWIALVIAAATVLLTLFDRRFDKAFPKSWRDGVAESFYSVMSVATSGKPPARKNLFGWIGRIGQGLWLVSGIAVMAFVTSSVTSVMTTLSLTNQINSLNDLSGRPVAVMQGTVQQEYARAEGLSVRSFDGFDKAMEALVGGDVAAIVHDAPVLEYHAHKHPDDPVKVVGRLFNKAKYGFALPHGSELTKSLTVEVLGVLESGEVARLQTRYFGS